MRDDMDEVVAYVHLQTNFMIQQEMVADEVVEDSITAAILRLKKEHHARTKRLKLCTYD